MTHARTEFEFTVEAAYADVAPLFGAHEERTWAAGWDPRFVHPDPARDVEGAVFLVDPDAAAPTVWVNTVFDLAGGRVQYVNFAPTSVVTRIDIRLRALSAAATSVRVAYERTAVDPAAADEVGRLAEADRGKAPEWLEEITACLEGTTAG